MQPSEIHLRNEISLLQESLKTAKKEAKEGIKSQIKELQSQLPNQSNDSDSEPIELGA